MKSKILLVDDQPENLVALEAALSPLDQTLVRATSGEEALKALHEGEFALVLLATQMSGMDGKETTAHIKRRAQTRDTPIILVSRFGMNPHDTFRGYAAGAVDYVVWPHDPWVLCAKVTVFVDLHQKNLQLREQAALLRTGVSTLGTGVSPPLLAHLASLLLDIEEQTRDLTELLQAQPSSVTVRAMVARVAHTIQGLRHLLQGALELRE
ncbi:response regulator [Streptomyces globisporus]|uniref:response regulator n=1 Tax=Streptomyces globisporus TaxID=1908 RepID=UPI0034607EF3